MTRQRNNTLPKSIESETTIPEQQKTDRQQPKKSSSLDRLLLRLFLVLLGISLGDLMLSSSSPSPVDYTYQLPPTAAPTQAPKQPSPTPQPSPAPTNPPTTEPTAEGTTSGTTSGTQVGNQAQKRPSRPKKRKRISGPLERTNDEKTSNREGD